MSTTRTTATASLSHGLAAVLALALAGCGERPAAPPGPGPSAPLATIPLRQVWVAAGPRSGWPDVPVRTPQETLARAEAARARLVAGEDFAQVAAEMSDDPTSKDSGGFVGFVGRHLGNRPELLTELAKLEDGQLSAPVITEHGVHVLQRLSRETGRRLEEKYLIPVWGFQVQWHGIVSSLPTSQTREQAYAEAARVATAIREGTIDAERGVGSLLGAHTIEVGLRPGAAGDLALVAAAAASLPVGGWAGPLETPRGWVVIRREPYHRIRLSHLLIAHQMSPGDLRKPARTEIEAMARAEEALARLRQDPSAWAQVVAEYSDDTSTKGAAGGLGDAANVEPPEKRPPPEVEAAAARLAPGEISDVTPGRLGVHLVRRED